MDYAVALSVEDVKRITENTEFKADFFVDVTPVDEMEFKCQDVRIGGRYVYMTLKRDERGCCVFSQLDGDNIKCKIHGCHPLVCRIYPFTEVEGNVAHRRKFRCERKWNLDGETKKRIRKLLDQREKEVREYEKAAQEWNKKGGGTKSEFLSFILG